MWRLSSKNCVHFLWLHCWHPFLNTNYIMQTSWRQMMQLYILCKAWIMRPNSMNGELPLKKSFEIHKEPQQLNTTPTPSLRTPKLLCQGSFSLWQCLNKLSSVNQVNQLCQGVDIKRVFKRFLLHHEKLLFYVMNLWCLSLANSENQMLILNLRSYRVHPKCNFSVLG